MTQPISRGDKIAGGGILALFIAILCWLIFAEISYQEKYEAQRRSGDFIPVKAKIIEASVSTKKSSSPHYRFTSPEWSYYKPNIKYEYIYEGKNYQSSRYHFLGHNFIDRKTFPNPADDGEPGFKQIETLMKAYEVDAIVTAYIDPDRPDVSVLNTTKPNNSGHNEMVVAIVIIYIFSALFFLFLWEKRFFFEGSPMK